MSNPTKEQIAHDLAIIYVQNEYRHRRDNERENESRLENQFPDVIGEAHMISRLYRNIYPEILSSFKSNE